MKKIKHLYIKYYNTLKKEMKRILEKGNNWKISVPQIQRSYPETGIWDKCSLRIWTNANGKLIHKKCSASLVFQKTQIRAMLRLYLTSPTMAIINKNVGRAMGKSNPSLLPAGVWTGATTVTICVEISQKLRLKVPFKPDISLLYITTK